MNLKNRSINIIYIAVFLFLAGPATLLLHRNYEQKKERYYAKLSDELRTAYNVITSSHSETAKIAFNTYIDQPEILEIYKQANSADEDTRNAARQQLLEELDPLYKRLKLRGVRQFHFHLPNSDSFLRFHRPEKYGDNLKGVRYSVDKTNTQLVEVFGFEEGRIFNGFRNVFPLIYNGKHLGSVEISMAFGAIRKRIEQQFPHQYAFIIKRHQVEEKVFIDEQSNYQPSDISDDYLYEQGYAAVDTLQAINAILKPTIQDRLQAGESFAVEARASDVVRLVIFLPIENVQGEQVAYIVSYNDDTTISRYYLEYIITLVISTGSIFAILLLVYLLTKNIRVVWAEKVKLQQERDMFISGSVVVFKWQNRENWPVEYVSANVKEILGYKAEEFLRGTILYANIVHPKDTIWVVDEATTHSRNHTDRFEHQPYRLIHQNGNIVWVLAYTTILRDKTGNITHYLGYLVDITKWKKSEEALRTSEERLELVLQGADLGMWDWNVQTGDVVFNKRWAEMLGYTPAEIEPNISSWEILIHPDEVLAVMAILTDHLEGRTPVYQTEYRLRAKSGEWKWILVTGKVFKRNEQGKPIRVAGTHQDITERKQAEQILVEHEQRLRTLINSTPDIICFKDGKGRWLEANHADLELFSLTKVDYWGKTDSELAEFTHPIYRDAFLTCEVTDEKAWQTDGISRREEVIPIPGGAEKTFDVIKVPIFEADGRRKGLVVQGRDITERKQMEQQLVQQERLAAVGQLAAGIAHDFNNILTSILGFSELLLMSPEMPETMQSSLQKISASSQRAAHLVRQLLDYSRKTIRRPQCFELDALLKESIAFFERTIPENVQINLNIEPGYYLIEADPTQLQQIITNLVVNARDAMPKGGRLDIGLSLLEMAGTENCTICHQPITGKWLNLTVTDSGSGITPEALTHIFEPFFTTKEVGRGTGLGLSQVYGIVTQHSGHLTVNSQVDRGTSITIYLPPVSKQNGKQTKEMPPMMLPGQGETILLVEDEPAVVDAVKAVLEHLHYQVITAVNGGEALAVYRKHRAEIVLVLSDIVMPDMDGEALFQTLKEETPDLKMVMMSGYPLGEKGAELLEQGVVAWFEKPISFGQLSQVVGKALSNRKERWG